MRKALKWNDCYQFYSLKDSGIRDLANVQGEIMEVLTKQLAQGWNPWITDNESRGFVYFDNCLERYLDYVDRMAYIS